MGMFDDCTNWPPTYDKERMARLAKPTFREKRDKEIIRLQDARRQYIIINSDEVKEFIDKDGFNDNSYPVVDEKGISAFGPNAYFINQEWYMEKKFESYIPEWCRK